MRALGFVFLLALIVGGVGIYQGWFTFGSVSAGGKNEVHLGVDGDKIDTDAQAAAKKLGELSAKVWESVKSLGRKVGPDETELEGTISTVDAATRNLTLSSGAETLDLHVDPAVVITRDGQAADFAALQAAMRAKFVFSSAGESRRLVRIEILR